MTKRKRDQRPPIEIAIETAGTVREAAGRAEHVARRLLRRTRLLTGQAARKLPVAPPHALDAADHITLVLPPSPTVAERAALEQELLELRARAERAEHAAAWLRARLRVERSRGQAAARTPRVDVAALAADLTRGLAGLHAPHPGAVRRVVQRTLAAHGLAAPGTGEVAPPPWSQEQQEALVRIVLARAPEVADPAYVFRAIGLLAQRGRLTLPELTRAAGFDSAMARRRLRLAVEALVALGALVARDGAYSLNLAWKPPAPTIPPHGRQGRKGASRR